MGLEERHRKRVEVEPIEAKRDHQVEVVEHLEYDEDGKQLEEVLSTPLIQVGWREMARDQAEARHDDRLEQREQSRPKRDR